MITIDTHVIIWHALQPDLLSQNAVAAIKKANASDGIIFCDISIWEIAMLIKKGRITLDCKYQDFIDLLRKTNNFIFKNITPEIAELSTTLPVEINKDTADRIISATSLTSNAPLVTADKNLQKSKIINTIW